MSNKITIEMLSRYAELEPEIKVQIVRLVNSLAAHATPIEQAVDILKVAQASVKDKFLTKDR